LWARIVLVLMTGPVMIGGAAIRRKARLALDEADAAAAATNAGSTA
jgi:hypothetical protein